MTLTLTRADAWQRRHTEQDNLADLKAQRRVIYATLGEAGAAEALRLDIAIAEAEATIAELGDAITDWTGVCA